MTSRPRERLVSTAIELVRKHGVEGTGLAELLERSNTARRSIYQHFPKGKLELIEASTYAAGDWIRRTLQRLAHPLLGHDLPALVAYALMQNRTERIVTGLTEEASRIFHDLLFHTDSRRTLGERKEKGHANHFREEEVIHRGN
jgi:AcrR family transcriptional regulator